MGCVSICRILLTQQTLLHCSSRHLTGRSPAIAWFRALSTQQTQNNNNPPPPGYLTSFSLCASYLKKDKDRPCDFSFIGEYGFNLPPQPTFPADRNSPRKFHQPPDVCYYDRYLEDLGWYLTSSLKGAYLGCFPPPDFVFYVDGRPIQAHKVILSARSPYFKHKFETDWKHLTYFIFSKDELSYKALDYLIYFFYSDWVDIALDNLQDFATISQIFRCESFSKIINKHLPCIYLSRHTHISFTGSLLPEEDRLPAALYRLLQSENVHDLADICVKVDQRIFRCHQVVLATRSKYFKNRIRHIYDSQQKDALPCLEEHDMNQVVFEKILEYMYTNDLKDIDPKQARELFDAALRYLLFPLHGVLVKILLPHVKMASSPAEICDWLLLADVDDLSKECSDHFYSVYHYYERQFGKKSRPTTDQEEIEPPPKKKSSFSILQSLIKGGKGTKGKSSSTPQSDLAEYNMYLAYDYLVALSEYEQADLDLLDWWRGNEPTLPILSAMAKDFFAVQASSVSSERAFSASKRVMTPHRSSLNSSTLEMCVCYKDWLDAYRRLQGLAPSDDESDNDDESSTESIKTTVSSSRPQLNDDPSPLHGETIP